MFCGECNRFDPVNDQPGIGSCHGNPPVVMLLPVVQSALAGQGQGFALQTVRPTVKATDRACRFFAVIHH